jgi:predicted GNAT family N-acyltransferase
MAGDGFSVALVCWSEARGQLQAVREAVFMREQGVPADLEWDGLDPACVHALATAAGGAAIGTARLTPDAHIGRMAVLAAWRRRGVGKTLLELMLEAARSRGFDRVALNAQTHAHGFYAHFGFRVEGREFLDAGIPHVRMTLGL